jgi:CheY-like chemotaxis protein
VIVPEFPSSLLYFSREPGNRFRVLMRLAVTLGNCCVLGRRYFVCHVAALLEFANPPRTQGSLGTKVPEASIFLVEDEALIRMMLADMVEELGHRVVAEAGNIRDGVALAGMAVFDFAILDINIGGYSISPVAKIIAERGLPFFFVSGYGAAGRPEAYSDRPVLQKPLLMAKLGEAINSILSVEIDRSGK